VEAMTAGTDARCEDLTPLGVHLSTLPIDARLAGLAAGVQGLAFRVKLQRPAMERFTTRDKVARHVTGCHFTQEMFLATSSDVISLDSRNDGSKCVG